MNDYNGDAISETEWDGMDRDEAMNYVQRADGHSIQTELLIQSIDAIRECVATNARCNHPPLDGSDDLCNGEDCIKCYVLTLANAVVPEPTPEDDVNYGADERTPASPAPEETRTCPNCGREGTTGGWSAGHCPYCGWAAKHPEPPPMKMNSDPEWLRKRAEAEAECESVAVGDPTTVECAWCHGTLLRKQPDPPPVSARELPACAALKFSDGLIVAGKRHDVCIKEAHRYRSTADIAEGVQGFMTTRGRFVDREEGWTLAIAAGVVINRPGVKILMSEDLY